MLFRKQSDKFSAAYAHYSTAHNVFGSKRGWLAVDFYATLLN